MQPTTTLSHIMHGMGLCDVTKAMTEEGKGMTQAQPRFHVFDGWSNWHDHITTCPLLAAKELASILEVTDTTVKLDCNSLMAGECFISLLEPGLTVRLTVHTFHLHQHSTGMSLRYNLEDLTQFSVPSLEQGHL
eukprot:1153215-Pelagomonas_calceolata.AAC.3